MIVDDEPDTVEFIKILLKREGSDVTTAHGGSECLSKLKKDVVDLILLDIRMPDIDGREVCREIRKRKEFNSIKIIYLTVVEPPEHLEKTMHQSRVTDYITKPFDNDDLIRRIDAILT